MRHIYVLELIRMVVDDRGLAHAQLVARKALEEREVMGLTLEPRAVIQAKAGKLYDRFVQHFGEPGFRGDGRVN